MTFKGIYIDGDQEIILEFEDSSGFQIWQQSMTAIKQEAAIIVAANEDAESLRMEDVNALRNWIRRVDEMVEARTPVLPSILTARNEFAEAIKNR
jgi:hypothetical protein